mmetsp:Transcript_88875/g.177739  ORF Transcript_88875/g.177739 Transcript_88875/m.177739 type:complete len:200 (+) Transcript_88875:222-821(+)
MTEKHVGVRFVNPQPELVIPRCKRKTAAVWVSDFHTDFRLHEKAQKRGPQLIRTLVPFVRHNGLELAVLLLPPRPPGLLPPYTRQRTAAAVQLKLNVFEQRAPAFRTFPPQARHLAQRQRGPEPTRTRRMLLCVDRKREGEPGSFRGAVKGPLAVQVARFGVAPHLVDRPRRRHNLPRIEVWFGLDVASGAAIHHRTTL